MITIDGSFGEGGGQILRTSLSLAAITGQDVTIENIRANRPKPGLRPQHLTGALAVAEICGAEIRGAEVGSTRLIFKPHTVKPGRYEFDVAKIRSSAGSVNLVLQTVLWPLAFTHKQSRITIKGGTHVPHAPTSDFINNTFLPTIAEMGLICHYEMITAGYYPIGGGEVRLEIRPVDELRPVHLTRHDEPIKVEIISAVSNLPMSIAERQLSVGIERISALKCAHTEKLTQYPSPGKGTVFFAGVSSGRIKAGFQSLGERGKPAEKVASDACDELETYLASGMALDKRLADQLIIPIALANGKSSFTTSEITMHLITNIAIVEKFLPVHFHMSGGLGEAGMVESFSA
ncbi:MAG: RNA 3'-terminal phosphate cyclase [Armatimonadota bacterium]|nr:RNA 3'-phosphate cyclase [bacterium]